MKKYRKNKMYVLVRSKSKNHVITSCEGMLSVFPKYKDAVECATMGEKVIPVMVTIESFQQ